MNRLLTGIVIAVAALFVSGGFVRDAMAGNAGTRPPAIADTASSRPPAGSSPSSGRVMSLVLTLEALRATPVVLDPQKV